MASTTELLQLFAAGRPITPKQLAELEHDDLIAEQHITPKGVDLLKGHHS